MDTLKQIFENHSERLLHKWDHYLDIYDRHFEKFRNKPIVFLEIGIAHGGSLQMWRKYFGEQALIIGVDVNPETKKFEEANTTIYIGSQEDKDFLNQLKKLIPVADVILDDGGHTMKQQINTFEVLFEHVKEGGLYVCEDLHTSYWAEYHGGYKKKSSFIEYSKNFIDFMHGWYAAKKDKHKIKNALTEKIYGVHYYDSIMVIEKEKVSTPKTTLKGNPQLERHFTDYGHSKGLYQKIKKRLKKMGNTKSLE